MKIKTNFSGVIKPKTIVDSPDGTLTVIESSVDFPFEMKRLYYINNFKDELSIRGRHAHKELWQAITCINGSFTLELDDSEKKQKIVLKKDSSCFILLGPGLWHEMTNITKDCVILVVASDIYEESDYIRSYDDFLDWHKKNK